MLFARVRVRLGTRARRESRTGKQRSRIAGSPVDDFRVADYWNVVFTRARGYFIFYFFPREMTDRRPSVLFGRHSDVVRTWRSRRRREIDNVKRLAVATTRQTNYRDGPSGCAKRGPRAIREWRESVVRYSARTERRYTFNLFRFPFEIENIVTAVCPTFIENVINAVDSTADAVIRYTRLNEFRGYVSAVIETLKRSQTFNEVTKTDGK